VEFAIGVTGAPGGAGVAAPARPLPPPSFSLRGHASDEATADADAVNATPVNAVPVNAVPVNAASPE
jgi:hypothetical protein